MNNKDTKLGKFFRLALWPLSIVYDLVTSIRNLLFDWGIFQIYQIPVFSIGVGNLAAGGTGKTPFVSYLIQHFKGKKIAVLSRGYGRRTKGFLEVSQEESTETVGDEIFMLFEKHSLQARFFVSENRKLGVEKLLDKYPDTEIIIFDDVFQHRAVKPTLMVMLSTFSKPFFKDYVLPLGLLREARRGAKRADFVIFTKCSGQVDATRFTEKTGIMKPIFFTKQKLLKPTNIFGDELLPKSQVHVLSALANNQQFVDQLSSGFEIQNTFRFADHHKYSILDIEKIDFSIPCITTEKDFVKIKALLKDERIGLFYTQKIETEFIIDESHFLKEIDQAFNTFVPDF